MNTNQPAVYDPLTRTLHWLTVAGFIGIPTTIVLWTIYSGLTKIRTATKPQTVQIVRQGEPTLYWLLLIYYLLSSSKRQNREEAEWVGSLFGLHKSFGFLTLTVITLRIVWAVANRAKRPQSDSKAAAAGHGILYLLMLAVPVIGMIRQYGSGRGPLKVFGVEVMQGSPEKIEWMANLGNTFHGNLGWLLFAAVVGHVAMVVVHRVQGKDVLYRMTGRVR
ncbi:cytochrome b [Neisseria meningitidis]|uniref:cytochrome b n=1 Tax=Neisseria meningitidis TaxID=487 RepID=UPI0005E2CBAD|nr:cytochrome b [Neisseria meningitidis]CKK18873.1 putative cytochrome B561 [Neisseria meningitidis]